MVVDSGLGDAAAAGLAAATSIKDRLAACEGLVSSLAQSTAPDALVLKAAKEEEGAQKHDGKEAKLPDVGSVSNEGAEGEVTVYHGGGSVLAAGAARASAGPAAAPFLSRNG